MIKWLQQLFGLGIYAFTHEELIQMRMVNDYDRFMENSGQFDDEEERLMRKPYETRVSLIREKLTQEQINFMERNHWRKWNSE